MQNKISIIIAGILLIFTFNAKAQVNLGSSYSRFGIGEIQTVYTGRSTGMGGIATGLRMPYEINPVNPASYSVIPEKIFLFQTGFKLIKTDYSVTDDKISDNDFRLNSVNAALSINKFWGMSFGMNPVSTVNYNIFTEDSVSVGDYTSHFNNRYIGEGGLTSVYFGNAFVFKGFSAGINISYIFGTLLNKVESFLNEDGYSSFVYVEDNSKINDFQIRYGIQYTDSLFKKIKVTAGAYFENKTDLNAVKTKFVSEIIKPASDITLSDTVMNDTLSEGVVQMPLAYGVGFSAMTEKWMFGLDYRCSNWDDVLFFEEKPSSLTNSSSVSAGVEFTDNPLSKKFLKRLNWRAGGYYKNTNIFLNGTQIKDYGINIGIGIPTKFGTKINIGFETGKRGTTDDNLVQENYYVINFNINLMDRWFVRRRFF
ncbi:MAG: hypothetical protein GXO50_02965 [Chlorobi bacterium]|nr:hypothetical protein [Chlorobiota bacterium]